MGSMSAQRISSPSTTVFDTNNQDVETSLRSLLEILNDEENRNIILEQVPGVGALLRRLSAGLLRRAAYRTANTNAIPEETRKVVADANRRLAEAIDVPQEEEEEAAVL